MGIDGHEAPNECPFAWRQASLADWLVVRVDAGAFADRST